VGNWRTVNINGTITNDEDLRRAHEFLTPDADYSNWTCLSYQDGLAGLGRWAAPRIRACGNLSERDYSVDDVAEALNGLVDHIGRVTCTFRAKVHCGGDWEDERCVATVTVAYGGAGTIVTIGPPEVARVETASPSDMLSRFYLQSAERNLELP
jgi:hypothetical protein